jgi:hypothetical protein
MNKTTSSFGIKVPQDVSRYLYNGGKVREEVKEEVKDEVDGEVKEVDGENQEGEAPRVENQVQKDFTVQTQTKPVGGLRMSKIALADYF